MSSVDTPADTTVRQLDDETAELALLLPARQAAALEHLAQARGVSAGHLLRCLVNDYLARSRPASAAQAAIATDRNFAPSPNERQPS